MRRRGGTGWTTRRRALGGALEAAGVLGFAACAPGGTGTGGGTAQQVKEQHGKLVFYTRGGEVETRGQAEILIPAFREVAPNVAVEHAVFAASGPDETYITKLFAMSAAGDPPDVWGFGGN